MHDTTPEADEVQRAAWKRMGPSARAAVALRMSEDLRQVTMDGIRHQHPGWSEERVREAMLRRVLGDELFEAAFRR